MHRDNPPQMTNADTASMIPGAPPQPTAPGQPGRAKRRRRRRHRHRKHGAQPDALAAQKAAGSPVSDPTPVSSPSAPTATGGSAQTPKKMRVPAASPAAPPPRAPLPEGNGNGNGRHEETPVPHPLQPILESGEEVVIFRARTAGPSRFVLRECFE